MSSLLQALLTFVGVMMVLALAAQSIQEVAKTVFTLKGDAQLRAMKGLIEESIKLHGPKDVDPKKVLDAVTARLSNLGQKGWFKVRLDELGAENLKDLIETLEPGAVSAAKGAATKAILGAIAAQAEKWYPLAVCPVDNRYRRRMRVVALLASAAVVVPLNAGADRIFNLARTDPAFRARVDSAAVHLGASPQDSTVGAAALVMVQQDSLGMFVPLSRDNLGSFSWWIGILLSVLLVSLGAPFWHDLLESLFGFKNRIRAEADKARGGAP